MFRFLYWSFLILFFICFILIKPVLAEQYFFQDEFNTERADNTLDPNRWTVYPNATLGVTTIQETGGNLVTTQNNFTNQYPMIISKNPALPTGDFESSISFQYTHVTPYGTGISLSETKPTVPGYDFGGLLALSIWQDNNIGLQMRLQYQATVVYSVPINTNPHIFKVIRTGLIYKLYFDGNLVYTSPDNPVQVRYIWLGNPTLQSGIPDWTKFNVDYIRVQATTKTPIILIPGIGGSEFKTAEDIFWNQDNGHGGFFNHSYPLGEKVWVNTTEAAKPGNDDYFDVLRMKSDGITPEANLELTGELFGGAYQGLIDFFTSNGYTLNQDLFVFPYDWRKDIALTATLLDQKINEIKTHTGATKVDIVAHSMGGLVARNYITDLGRAGNVGKLFELGVPHLGSVDLLKAINYGDCQTIRDTGPICIGIPPSETKDVIQNMIGGYQLAPTQKYFEFYNNSSILYPLPFNDSADIDNNGITGELNYNQIKSLLTNLGHNTSLFTPSETFHNLDNNLSNTNGVETYIISGSGIPTLGQIIEKNVINLAGIKINKKDELTINGDETVPLFSASLNDPIRNLSFSGNASIYYAKQQHSSLVSNGPALNLVKNILAGDNQIPDGVSQNPFPLNGHQLSVHSPVNMHVYDNNGNHTGPTLDGEFEANIPGSSYDSLDDVKFIFLPEDGTYRVNFIATDNGSFDFKIRDFQNDEVTDTTIYRNVPITSTTKAQIFFSTSFGTFPILIDEDGNGIFDSQVGPSGEISGNDLEDNTPPQVSIDASPKIIWSPNGKMIDVTVTGNSSDPNLYRTLITIEDEYHQVEPTVTGFNQTIKLQASRREDDLDGRKYTIKAIAEDLSGNFSEVKVEVIVPHDQRK